MNLSKTFRKKASYALNFTRHLRHELYQTFPEALGHEVKDSLVQFYRHDQHFETVVSFNHFIEFFSQKSEVDLQITVEAYDRKGHSFGKKNVLLRKKGSVQFSLGSLYSQLDEYGLFSISLELNPKFIKELAYFGAISPQFMTLYVPRDNKSAPQMIHSHKIKQGYLFIPRSHIRKSSHVEILSGIETFQIFGINSCKSKIHFKVDIFNGKDGAFLQEKSAVIEGHGTHSFSMPSEAFDKSIESLTFQYSYNRSVDHKKPIIFRRFKNESWSCNHT